MGYRRALEECQTLLGRAAAAARLRHGISAAAEQVSAALRCGGCAGNLWAPRLAPRDHGDVPVMTRSDGGPQEIRSISRFPGC